MSNSSSSPSSTPSRDSRRRKPYAQRKTLVRNSSLFGSLKNFVAAPFSRLFSGTAEDFDDDKDFSGKRRRAVPQSRNDFETTEDGPAPPKRLRVASPSLSPPANRGNSGGGYLDPPSSAFRRKSSSSPHNQPARSASITIPSTTISDNNNRSTISPLRRQMSSGMSIDSRPSTNTYHRNISRDSPMGSVPLVGTADRNTSRAQPNDRLSMPPLSGRPSFIMRSSMTPQPQRDVSEPPPITSLTSHPVFVRAPSQANEQRQKSATPTLGSLVDFQRQAQNSQNTSSARQRGSLLFGRQVQDSQSSQSSVLQELEFYRTPLVPTRLRSKDLKNGNTADITDMFSRKRSLILMGDDNRVRLGRRGSRKEKKDVEDNESKPYAGTTGLKKRLAKHKQDEVDEVLQQGDKDDSMMSDKPPVPEVKESTPQEIPPPPPPPAGRDFFSLAPSSATSSSPQTSSLRVGRASRSHISRPSRPSKTKFSAAFDDDEDVSEESRNEMAALEEAAKKVPVFQVPAGFTFAKDTKPVEADSTNAKEPPLTSLPFSLTTSASPSFTPLANTKPQPPSNDASASETRLGSPPRNVPETTPKGTAVSTSEPSSEGKVPNFFASSKFLSNENTPTPSFGIATPPSNPQPGSGSASPFTLPPSSGFSLPPASSPGLVSAAVPPKETDTPLWQKTDDTTSTSAIGTSSNVPTMFSFAPQSDTSIFGAPTAEAKQQNTAAKSSSSTPFSFGKPTNEEPPTSAGISFLLTPPAPVPSTTNENPTPSLFGGSSATTSIFGNKDAPAPPSSGSLFSTSSAPAAAGSLFGAPKPFEAEVKKADSSASGSPFMFGQKTEQSTSLFGSGDKPKLDLFGQPPASQNTASSSFSFGGTPEPPKPAFSFGGQTSGTSASAATTPSTEAPNPFAFGNASASKPAASNEAPKGFSFGASSNPPTPSEPAKPFSFGTTPAATPTVSEPSKGFSFGSTTTPSANEPSKGFSFGSGASTSGSAGASTGFSFGTSPASAPTGFGESKPSFPFGSSRPVTPPPNLDQEVRMEESPTRDLQKPSEPRPSLGFSFGSGTSSPFGQSSTNQATSAPTSSPFSFGGSSNSGSGFGIKTDVKPASSPFSFGQAQPTSATSTSSPFGFGATKPDNEPPRPATTGSFSFGQSPSTTTSPFSFGAPPSNASNTFGAAQPGSAPGSPSTFSQTPAFGNTGSNPFSFGSQPASPATPSSSLPQSSAFGAPGGGFGAAQPSGGGSLFTIGSSSPANPQARQIKRLPKRGGKR